MWYDAILEKIKKFNTKVKEVEIRVNNQNINNIIGHKRENINKLKDIYDVDVTVVQDDSINPGKFKIRILIIKIIFKIILDFFLIKTLIIFANIIINYIIN